jgi:sec-independent protein translocase protein TatA
VIGDILQPTHLLFILVIALLVLGPKRLPEVGRALGRGMRDFRSALSGADPRDELNELTQQTMQPTTVATPVQAPTPAHDDAPAEQAPPPEPVSVAPQPRPPAEPSA